MSFKFQIGDLVSILNTRYENKTFVTEIIDLGILTKIDTFENCKDHFLKDNSLSIDELDIDEMLSNDTIVYKVGNYWYFEDEWLTVIPFEKQHIEQFNNK